VLRSPDVGPTGQLVTKRDGALYALALYPPDLRFDHAAGPPLDGALRTIILSARPVVGGRLGRAVSTSCPALAEGSVNVPTVIMPLRGPGGPGPRSYHAPVQDSDRMDLLGCSDNATGADLTVHL